MNKVSTCVVLRFYNQPYLRHSRGRRPPQTRQVTDVNHVDEQTNLPNGANQPDASQQLSPSILSQSFQRNNFNSNQIQNNPGQISKQKQTQQNTKQHVSRPVSHSADETRDRSESMGRHDSRGRPRNVNNRGRSRSVKPRDNNTSSAAKAQQNEQNDQQSAYFTNEHTNTQNKD